ncbi:MAG: translation initiation factor [Candidatus Promineifilaceae bacterium]
MPRKRNIVYSSADDDFKVRPPEPRKTVAKSVPAAQQTIAILRDKKGRGGKQVTVMRDFQLSEKDLEALGKQLKKACGSGGTVKEGGIIEIQGDHRDRLAELLQKQGYKTKFVGG